MRSIRGQAHRGRAVAALVGFLLTAAAVAAAAVAPAAWSAGVPDRAARGPVAPLGHDGRWLTDARGRVVTLHGVNEVTKKAPFQPAGDGFGVDDARFLADHGFDLVRVGVEFRGLMPEPGQIDPDYVRALAGVVRDLRRENVFVLLDFHQDCYGVAFRDNGFPAWMTLTDGLPDAPDVTFPLCYILNSALQRAFENLWANRPGPNGVGLQDYYVQGLRAVVERFAGDPWVLGYELLNEPWPGADFGDCFSAAGCPDLEQTRLAPFYRKATATVRRISRRQQVFVEPFVTFNFGQSPTTLPGASSGDALSTHSYAADPAHESSVADESVAAAERDGAALLVTEFGATTDVTTLRRVIDGLDTRGVSWAFWAYNEELIRDRSRPAGLEVLASRPTFDALVEPYPLALTGVPETGHWDPATRSYALTYAARDPRGRRYPASMESVLWVPRLHYPDGYRVDVVGATVTSPPCAERLTLRTRRSATEVHVVVTPGAACG